MTDFTAASSFVLTQESVRFFEQTIDDWIHDVPEILEFLHYCRYFLMVIEVKFTPDEKEKLEALGADAIDEDAFRATVSEAGLEFLGHEQTISRPRLHRSNSNDTTPTRKQDRMNSWINQPIEYYQSHRLERAKAGKFNNRHKSSKQEKDKIDKEATVTREIAQRIVTAEKFLTEFMEEDDRKMTFQESINWTIQHEGWASDLREYFRKETIIMGVRLNDLLLCPGIKAREAIIKADHLERHMTRFAYRYWFRMVGLRVSTELREFMEDYVGLFGDLGANDREYIERALGSNDKNNPEITIFGFINFTNKHGFPFERNTISSTRESQEIKSESRRVESHKMAMELVESFQTIKARDSTAHSLSRARDLIPKFMRVWRYDAVTRKILDDRETSSTFYFWADTLKSERLNFPNSEVRNFVLKYGEYRW